MKNYIFIIALTAINITAFSQTVNIHFKNGQTIEYPSANVDYVDFSAKPSEPTITAGQVVDLGLSVYWASCNLGAETPEEIGDSYAWGETKSKITFNNENYSYYDTNTMQFVDIGNDISGTQYDAATVNLGSDWRIPTKAEMEELIYNCTWEWIMINGKRGYKVIGKNNNSIFLPCIDKYNCMYRTSTASPYSAIYTYGLWATSTDVKMSSAMIGKSDGFPIRPITSNPNAGGNPIDHSQDYLVTEKVSASFTGGSTYSINGIIQSGSVLNVKFTNGSSELVTLVGAQINDAANSNQGNNVLEADIAVAAGESKSYSITLGTNVTTPVVCFTYRYNKKNYKAEATWGN